MIKFFNYNIKINPLLILSAAFTLGLMILLFIFAQTWSFTLLLPETRPEQSKMQAYELIKLKFIEPIAKEPPEQLNKREMTFKVPKKRTGKQEKNDHSAETKSPPGVTTSAQDFEIKKLITNKATAAKRGGADRQKENFAGISTNVNRQTSSLQDFDLDGVLANRPAARAASRRGALGGSGGSGVIIGAGSSRGIGAGLDGAALSGIGGSTGRTIRSTGNGTGTGTGGPAITLPAAGSRGEDAAIDLHALIKWMKAHPGPIPKLVAYDMGHHTEDLSSAISFTRSGRQFRIFLSCNEIEQLLRICLVESDDFTLLKDNGISEASNFLTIGDVVKQEGEIKSLISSRQAPRERATAFYSIFWSWWQEQTG